MLIATEISSNLMVTFSLEPKTPGTDYTLVLLLYVSALELMSFELGCVQEGKEATVMVISIFWAYCRATCMNVLYRPGCVSQSCSLLGNTPCSLSRRAWLGRAYARLRLFTSCTCMRITMYYCAYRHITTRKTDFMDMVY